MRSRQYTANWATTGKAVAVQAKAQSNHECHCSAEQGRETSISSRTTQANSLDTSLLPCQILYRHTSWPGPILTVKGLLSGEIPSAYPDASHYSEQFNKNLQTVHCGSLLTLIRSGSSTTLAKQGRRLVTNMSSFFPLLDVLHFPFLLCWWGWSWETACKPKRDITHQKAEEGQYPKRSMIFYQFASGKVLFVNCFSKRDTPPMFMMLNCFT